MSPSSKRTNPQRNRTRPSSRTRSHGRRAPARAPKAALTLFSDFDMTMVPVHTARVLTTYYLVHNPHHEPLHRRFGRSFVAASTSMRNLAAYYGCLQRIPGPALQQLLAQVHVNPAWLQAVKALRLRARARSADVTIVSRNCIDVVHAWVMQNRSILNAHRISIKGIIANGPLGASPVLVRERSDLQHLDYPGFGQLHENEKRKFVPAHAIYIGDADDELLRPFVKEYVRV